MNPAQGYSAPRVIHPVCVWKGVCLFKSQSFSTRSDTVEGPGCHYNDVLGPELGDRQTETSGGWLPFGLADNFRYLMTTQPYPASKVPSPPLH